MSTISKIFNFDNIGVKIKNLTKWFCWITIFLMWVTAPIAFIVLISDEWTVEYCWIPLVGAVVGSVLVWVGSWIVYAFGEFVDDTNEIRRQNATANKNIKLLAQLVEDEFEEADCQSKGKPQGESEVINKENNENLTDTQSFLSTSRGTIICLECNSEQPDTRKTCWSCGAIFE